MSDNSTSERDSGLWIRIQEGNLAAARGAAFHVATDILSNL
jgi:hypothetical protein